MPEKSVVGKLLPGVQRAVLTVVPHSDVSNPGGIRVSNCENIPRLVERSKRVHSWPREAGQPVRSFDRLTMPDRSSSYPPR
jgi:hypothetical protein